MSGDVDRSAAAVPAETGAVTDRGRPRYRVGALLGRGGAAVVHRGWDRVLHRPVALKVLSHDVALSTDDPHREARLAAGLDHPRLVSIYDVSRLDGHDTVVMQLVEGPSLACHLRERGPLTLPQTLLLGAQLADGLAHVHARGVIHRDVKPANVLLADDGAQLTDFGIARVPGTTTITGDGLVLGTAAYLAPEQVRSEEVGPAADVFALGLVLLECLTAQSAYSSEPAQCAARLDVLARVPEDVDQDATELLRDLVALDAADRPSAIDAASRLRTMHAKLDLAPVLVGTAVPSPASAPRFSTGTRVTAGLLVAAVVLAAIALVMGRPDVAVPVLVAAVAAQGAVLCFALARRSRPAPGPTRGAQPPDEPGPQAPAGL